MFTCWKSIWGINAAPLPGGSLWCGLSVWCIPLNVFKFYPCFHRWQDSTLSDSWMVVPWASLLYFLYQQIGWDTSRLLFPFLGYGGKFYSKQATHMWLWHANFTSFGSITNWGIPALCGNLIFCGTFLLPSRIYTSTNSVLGGGFLFSTSCQHLLSLF